MSHCSIETKVDDIVEEHVIASLTVGALPIPMIDFLSLSVIQANMIKNLCLAYGHSYQDHQVKSWVASIAGGYGAVYIGSRMLVSWLRVVPGVSIATSVSAAATTYALSLVFRQHFAAGGTPQSVNVKTMAAEYEQQLPAAKQKIKTESAEKPKQNQSVSPSQQPKPNLKPDDLTKIDGIGPKIKSLLIASGIETFHQLATAKVEDLQQVLDAAGSRYRICDPQTWSEQAILADKADWDGLKELQDHWKSARS